MESKDIKKDSSQRAKFKFCYIIRGLPGTGKSTIAKQLAGEQGVILKFEPKINKTGEH